MQIMTVAELKAALHDGEEVALLDAREEVPFDARHILMASCVPLGRIEVLASELLPRKDVRVVWCDHGEGLAASAAARLATMGYSDVSLLEGGVAAWADAGHPVYSGVHVPSKAFAEVVEHEAGTPWIDAAELKSMIDAQADMVRNIIPEGVECIFVRQAEQLGLGHAVLCAERAVGGDPFAVLLADDFLTDYEPGVTADLGQAF